MPVVAADARWRMRSLGDGFYRLIVNRNAVHDERRYGRPLDQVVEIGAQIRIGTWQCLVPRCLMAFKSLGTMQEFVFPTGQNALTGGASHRGPVPAASPNQGVLPCRNLLRVLSATRSSFASCP